MLISLLCHCMFDQLFKNDKIVLAKPLNNTRKVQEVSSNPIRITLDFHFLDKANKDSKRCDSVGQTVVWGRTQYTCTNEDILTDQKISAIKGTMKNVKKYLESIFYVDTYTSPIDIELHPWYFDTTGPKKTATDTDLYLTVTSRTYGASSTLASANSLQFDYDTYRPIEGGIYINAREAPLEVQDENTKSNLFFTVCVHEIFHAMGISNNLFEHYHPRHDNKPYENPLCSILDTKTGKSHTFLVTPHAHSFAMQQWGEEYFTSGSSSCLSGIELEDGGGSGTAMSHPEGRIANTDLMTGVTLQTEKGHYSRFTPLTMAILLDTGFYDIDYHKIQPLLWGNKDTIDGNYIKDFVMGAPYEVFPPKYMYRPDEDLEDDPAGFDFKTTGGLSQLKLSQNPSFDCNNPSETDKYANTKLYCSAKEFFNPRNVDVIGFSYIYDFMNIHFPSMDVCEKGYAAISGMRKCAEYKIAPDEKSFSMMLVDEPNHTFEFVCDKENKRLAYKEYFEEFSYYEREVQCPPIKQFINTVRMYEDHPYLTEYPFKDISKEPNPPPNPNVDPDTKPNPNEDPEKSDSKINIFGMEISKTTFYICVAAVAVVIIIIIIIICCCCCCKSKNDSDEDNEDSDDFGNLYA